MRDALQPLQFVEKNSIKVDVSTKEVKFKVKDKEKADMAKVKEAIEASGRYHVASDKAAESK